MSTPRSRKFVLVGLLAAALAVHAADDDVAQRRRIEREQVEADARARSAEAACAERFVVSSCLANARAERRAATQQLDHQRAVLDDAQRKRRAADRQARIRERQDATAKADEARSPPPALPIQPGAAAPLPRGPAAKSGSATQLDSRRARSALAVKEKHAAERRAAASKERAEKVAAHRSAMEQRNRERDAKRPPAQALPIPASGAASAALR